MTQNLDAAGAPAPSGGHVVLVAEPNQRFAVTQGLAGSSFEPFALPRVPVSLLAWCNMVAQIFRARHGRCLACLLTMDPFARHWTKAVVPHQRCEQKRSTFLALFTDVPLGSLVAGSAQSAVLDVHADVQTLVPDFDGLHVIDDPTDDRQDVTPRCFVRAGGALSPIGAESVVFDDWVAALRQHADRMTFE